MGKNDTFTKIIGLGDNVTMSAIGIVLMFGNIANNVLGTQGSFFAGVLLASLGAITGALELVGTKNKMLDGFVGLTDNLLFAFVGVFFILNPTLWAVAPIWAHYVIGGFIVLYAIASAIPEMQKAF